MAVPGAEHTDAPARLTPGMVSRRLLVLAFVRSYIEQWGASPSYGEIAAGVGVNRARAYQLVRKLVSSGQLLRRPGPRGLTLPDTRDEAVRALRELNWTVDEDLGQALAPYTHSRLIAAPPLTYPHGDAGDLRNGKTAAGEREGAARIRRIRRAAPKGARDVG